MEPGSTTHRTESDAAPTVDLSGRCIGNSYILIRPIGQGATGTVWRAVDRATGEEIAVKLLREHLSHQPKLVTRFVQERTILLMLRHEYIVRVRDLLTVGDSLGLVMDLVNGGSLAGYLERAGSLPPAAAARLLAQVAAALAAAHELGVVHRDLKPDNILLHDTGGTVDTRLTDFGVARVLDAPGITTPQALVGTPNYMAPETISGGSPTPATDVYALGIVLYELLTGRPPFTGGPAAAILRRHLDGPPPRHPGIPAAAWAVVAACLDADPARRPAAADLVTTLRSLARALADAPALPVPGTGSWTGHGFGTEDLPPVPAAVAAQDTTRLAARPARPPATGRRPGPGRGNRPGNGRWTRPVLVVAVLAGLLGASGVAAVRHWNLLDAVRSPSGTAAGRYPSTGTAGRAAPADPVGTTAPSGAPAPYLSGVPVAAAGAAQPPAAAQSGTVVRGGLAAGPARVAARAEAFGPYQCPDSYTWDVGHPVLAQPCYTVAGDIRVLGHMQAVPGVQADVSLTLQDADTGTALAGPYGCTGLMFTDFAPDHSCGPFDLDVPHGHRCVVVQTWRYTGRGLLPGGTARSDVFSW